MLPVNVKGCDNLREGHVCSNGTGNSHLVNLQVGVRRDDSSGRKVYTLAHQITSDTSFLPLKPLLDGFQRAARLLHCLKQKAQVFTRGRTTAYETSLSTTKKKSNQLEHYVCRTYSW